PGSYPTGIEGWVRPPHIHFYATGRNQALATQMYFPGEAPNAQDRLLQSSAPNQATLIAQADPAGEGLEPGSLVVTWDIVLPRG
ncbi:MAG: protocatechuate 3,4-dioxygenase, partial [Gammaproteobacteria bacterium]